ncbi:MAG: hypothetical protein QW320_10040 [Ignisphaera sp.]
MISLQPIQTVTVSSPWSSALNYPNRVEILDPSTPTFAFDYGTGGIAVGFVSGTNASSLYSQCDANLLTMPALYSSYYNTAIIGGGACSCSPCLSISNSSGCGPWFQIVNLSNGSFVSSSSLPCPFIPSTSYSGHVFGFIYDLIDGYMIMSINYSGTYLIFYFIPLTQLGTLFSGTFPSTYYTVMVQIPNTNLNIYPNPTYLWNGNIIQPAYDSSYNQYIWMIPISTLMQNMQSGGPSGSSITTGNIYQVYAPGNLSNGYGQATVLLYPTSSGPKSVIALAGCSSSTVTVTIWDPSTQSTLKQVKADVKNPNCAQSRFYKNTFLITSGSNTITLLDIITGDVESISSSVDASLIPTSRGYVLGTRNPLYQSSVTFDIYKVVYQNDFQFTNVTFAPFKITGTLYNATIGQGIPNQTVYLVKLRSMYSNYIGDSVPVASATTDSNGQFTINLASPLGEPVLTFGVNIALKLGTNYSSLFTTYYGLVYMPY